MVTLVQPRHHIDARQVGISVVCGLGPRVPHDPILEDRSALRQKAAQSFPARMVHARERPDSGLRVRVWRRQPTVHAWAVWRVYKMTGPRGQRDLAFLESAFQKLMLDFTWWVNRKDAEGNN